MKIDKLTCKYLASDLTWEPTRTCFSPTFDSRPAGKINWFSVSEEVWGVRSEVGGCWLVVLVGIVRRERRGEVRSIMRWCHCHVSFGRQSRPTWPRQGGDNVCQTSQTHKNQDFFSSTNSKKRRRQPNSCWNIFREGFQNKSLVYRGFKPFIAARKKIIL